MVNLPLPAVKSIEETIKYDVFQIDTFVSEKKEKILIENILIGCEGSRWHPSSADINARGNNKAVGVEVFLSTMISLEKTHWLSEMGEMIS